MSQYTRNPFNCNEDPGEIGNLSREQKRDRQGSHREYSLLHEAELKDQRKVVWKIGRIYGFLPAGRTAVSEIQGEIRDN